MQENMLIILPLSWLHQLPFEMHPRPDYFLLESFIPRGNRMRRQNTSIPVKYGQVAELPYSMVLHRLGYLAVSRESKFFP
jgi:hypothetical protein